jgi:hypothetical protein
LLERETLDEEEFRRLAGDAGATPEATGVPSGIEVASGS